MEGNYRHRKVTSSIKPELAERREDSTDGSHDRAQSYRGAGSNFENLNEINVSPDQPALQRRLCCARHCQPGKPEPGKIRQSLGNQGEDQCLEGCLPPGIGNAESEGSAVPQRSKRKAAEVMFSGSSWQIFSE
jgi:hypothetical protein